MSVASHYSNLERYYNIVYDQQFSPNGKFLATCDAFGRLAVFSLLSSLSHSASDDGKMPLKVKQAHQGPVYSITSAASVLISGGSDSIKVWRWEELTAPSKDPQCTRVLTPPLGKQGSTDTNCLVYDELTKTLYAGCGDGNIHAWDLNTATLKSTLSGHGSYVHCVSLRKGGTVLSASDDGTVKLWDPSSSSKGPAQTWKPAKGSTQWVGCVAVDSGGDWMVCGGSMAPTIYHLGSNSKIASLPVPAGVVTQTAIFAKDRIITAGSESTIRHWSVNGEPLAAVPGSHHHIFSLAYNIQHRSKQYQVLTVSGDSSSVNVFTDFGYKAFSLNIIT